MHLQYWLAGWRVGANWLLPLFVARLAFLQDSPLQSIQCHFEILLEAIFYFL